MAVTAVLGPTNTGKTHLAVERMVAHSSGVIGFPLRLLAREVYDRVVKLKGEGQVALVTGEERIVPRDARWFCCTAESMPLRGARQGESANQDSRDFAFAALDEAQLGADLERGHVFTDRLLHARGREETMLLGSEALRPLVKALVPEAEIVGRPRFSTLRYAGAKKISRLPRRSAIVAFSAEEVYAVAEMLRRQRGGAAVVMGALSPRTRNAQVAMFQAGEVDYLVATDAIGMGLNMDVAHVAFAGLHKFDGRRRRRLTVAEMAQIAGRAGRHQRDGTFGGVVEEGPDAFLPEEVLAIEEHRFPRLDTLFWRDGQPDLATLDGLIASLEAPPDDPALRPAPPALDLAVLKRLADDPAVRDRARGPGVALLWAACGVPDFQKLGLDPHARFVQRLFGYLVAGHLPQQWFADEVARLDRVDGDVEVLAGRLAAIRTWAYLAQRRDWLADPAHWAERTRGIEERLSDALHASLTQRFVDKRTTVLMRQLGSGAVHLPVTIGAEGEVLVEDQSIGRLAGFAFEVASDARASDKRMLLAAAEKRLGTERAKRADALAEAADADIALPLPQAGGAWGVGTRPLTSLPAETASPPPTPPASGRGASAQLTWAAHPVATLTPGPSLARPRVQLDPSLASLDRTQAARIQARLERWVADAIRRHAAPLARLADLARAPDAGPQLRSIAAALEAGAGLAAKRPHAAALAALAPEQRKRLRSAGITIGALDLFAPALLKPAAQQWRARLLGLAGEAPALPAEGATVLPRAAPGASAAMGYRPFGPQAVRVDLAERLARGAHDARAGRQPFTPDPALATSIGLRPETLARLMAELGFRAKGDAWVWRGRPPVAMRPTTNPTGAFAALADLDLG